VNSGTMNQSGVRQVGLIIQDWLAGLDADVRLIPTPSAPLVNDVGTQDRLDLSETIVASCREEAPRQVLLGIHTDTVYGLESAFQSVSCPQPDRCHGPGVADAKGGIVVMVAALEAFERYRESDQVGWTVFLNPDEEIGSPGSVSLLQQLASGADFGMVYEPSLPDGTIISDRKGSANYVLVVRGKAAHAGREFSAGRNAIAMLCKLLIEIEGMTTGDESITVNLGKVTGGGPVNIVPDLAVGRFNVRVKHSDDVSAIGKRLEEMVGRAGESDGYEVQLHGGFLSPPKVLDKGTQTLLDRVVDAAGQMGLELRAADSGGVCDGNKLAAAGLPNIDTLGPRGGNIHSDEEYLLIDSLAERAELSCRVMQAFEAHPERFPRRADLVSGAV
ncbi:MAG: hydrolase, partial [Planctomycetota bacterium]